MDKLFKLFDQYPAIPFGMLALLFIMAYLNRKGHGGRQNSSDFAADIDVARNPGRSLDQVLFKWTDCDSFRIRDLLNGGALILGRAGSGKTSSSGRTLMQAIADNPRSGGLILAAKPEDTADVQAVFRRAKRTKDLVLFGADTPYRTNFFGCLRRPRDVVQFVTTMSEVLKRGDSKGGGENNRFYDAQEERCIYNAVAALQTAKEPLTARNIHTFIMSAATTPAELQTPEWQRKYHSKVLERGFNSKKTIMEESDYQLCADFWLKEWAQLMDSKVRGNTLAGVQGSLHTMNTGIVKEMVSGEMNCSPVDVLNGKWILVNFPPSAWGAAGLLISVGWKHLMELSILERQAEEDSPFVTIWCDEAHQFVTNYDSSFIAQCRSHKGCLCYLTQSVSSFYANMKGEAGKHQSDALLANFSHVIVHASDPVTAKWASSKLGRRKEMLFGGSSQPKEFNPFDEIFGSPRTSGSFSEHYEQVLQDQEFMVGRTGGPDNNFIADAIILKSGEPFANGKNYLKRPFKQR